VGKPLPTGTVCHSIGSGFPSHGYAHARKLAAPDACNPGPWHAHDATAPLTWYASTSTWARAHEHVRVQVAMKAHARLENPMEYIRKSRPNRRCTHLRDHIRLRDKYLQCDDGVTRYILIHVQSCDPLLSQTNSLSASLPPCQVSLIPLSLPLSLPLALPLSL
jgi:hypothetical protein